MENLKFYNTLRSVPEKYTKKITGGRLNGMTDIKPQWRTEKMTEIFGPCGIGWYYEETKREYKDFDGQIAVFIDINLFYRYEKIDSVSERVIGYEWSKPIHGTGGSMFVAKENRGPFVSDEAVKMALTDALSVAMKSLGMAADIYMGMPATGTKYDKPVEQQPQAKPQEHPGPQQEKQEPKREYMTPNHVRFAEFCQKIEAGAVDKLGNRITSATMQEFFACSPEAIKQFDAAEKEFLTKNTK